MAGTPTPVYGWPRPALTDPPDGPAQISALAIAVETTMQGIDTSVNSPPVVRARRTTAQSIPDNATTVVAFPTKDEDPTGIANAGGDAFTIKKAGLYLIMTSVTFASHVTGGRALYINVAGSTQASVTTMAVTQSGWGTSMQVSALERTVVGNVVTVAALQRSGAPLLTDTAPWFAMLWLRP